MSSPAAPGLPAAEAREWMQIWADNLGQVLTQVAGAACAVECLEAAPPEALPPQTTDLQVLVTAAGALRGELSLRLPQAAVLSLAQVFLSEAQEPTAEFKPETREAAEELLRQVAGQTATAFGARWGEVHLRLELGTPPSWPAGANGFIASAANAPCRMWLEWQMSAALLAALRAPPAAAVQAASVPEVSAPAPPPVRSGADAKLDLLMDVELEVTLRFGARRMLLREILVLGPGSVVELDRQVREPVDLLLDGKLIARGEVVVVDGNYGLRVQEVVSRPASI